MKHAVKGKQLNRDSGHRRGLFKNLVNSILTHGKITTTKAKAAAVQPIVEKLITKAKNNTVHHRRLIDKQVNQRRIVNRLVDEIAPKSAQRNGGYTRITKIGQRRGDAAEMVSIELIDWKPTVAPLKTEAKATSTKTASKKPAVKKTETKKAAPATPSTQDAAVASKHSKVTEASTTAKHIPQKRMSGGGK